MKRNLFRRVNHRKNGCSRLLFLSMLSFLLVLASSGLHAQSQQTITLNMKQATIEQVVNKIKETTRYEFFYRVNDLPVTPLRDYTFNRATIDEVMGKLVEGTNLGWTNRNGTITISVKQVTGTRGGTITGKVTSLSGEPLEKATVTVVGTGRGVVTDANGNFSMDRLDAETVRLEVAFLGMIPRQVVVKVGSATEIALEAKVTEVEEVVVTGIYTRNKESFTGSVSTYTQTDLKRAGSTNILQNLKTVDPSFAFIDNIQFGSDPNRLPDIEIRGKSSMLGVRDELEADPNQPLFILDGFESSLEAINDLDINRVASITILKDAASTAIYGSKAANGVVVVETVKPVAGKLQVSYTGNANFSIPDLSSYNMMNAREKLAFEMLAGRYDLSRIASDEIRSAAQIKRSGIYNEKLRALAEGVDTYWLAEPLRTGVNQRHSLYAMGGEGDFMFGLGGTYNGVTGVMKKSNRQVISGNIDLIYRVSNFQFSNKFSATFTKLENPIVSFSEYAATNPYYKKTDEVVGVSPWLEYNDIIIASNPLWNARLNSRDIGKNFGLSNYFVAEWSPTREWRVRARFGLTYTNNDTERFISPEDTRQITNKAITERGEFYTTNLRGNRYEGEFTVTYAKLIAKHRFNVVGGGNVYSDESLRQGYAAEGFPAGDFSYPSFASGYPRGGKPTYQESVSRSVNGYLNFGYAFDDRYLADFNLRSSGSSVFGSTKTFNTTWSVGIAWNLHREKFIADNAAWIDVFKLRGSIGNPGNQSFDSGKTLFTYAFQYGMLNYFGLGALPDQLGNPDLKWQITNDRNVGLDLTLFNRRFSLTFDYFNKVTNPLLVSIAMPLSSGARNYYTNAGEQTSEGLTFAASYYILRDTGRRMIWSVRVNGRTQNTRIDKIGDQLSDFNMAGRGVNTIRYYDGADPDDLWAVKSAGIDPANGKELFYTKDGGLTYDFSYDNEVICGNARPDLEGVTGTSFTWRGFTGTLNFRYQFGAEVFNSAILNKVENVDLNTNQDRRALYERWQNPGDLCYFKNIASVNPSPISSRFVQTENVFALESVQLEYQFFDGWIQRLGLSNLRMFFSMRDVFRASTIRSERGINYPFARTMDAGLSFNF